MKLSVGNIYDLFSPTECEKRLFYRYKGEEETPPGPFEEVILMLGKRHEENHINSLGKRGTATIFIILKKGEKGTAPIF